MPVDKNYSLSFNQNKASPVFNYVWDSTALVTGAGGDVTTGAWRPDTGSSGGGGSIDLTTTNGLITTTNSLLTSGNALTSGQNAILVAANTYHSTTSKTCSTNFTGSLLGKSGAGEVHGVFGYCSGVSQFLRVYDGTNVSGTLVGVIAVAAANNFSIDFSSKGLAVSTGIFAALSSSASSHVATGNDAIITILWK